MKSKLFNYQLEIFEKNKNIDGIPLYMGMGTGKTITSLALFEYKMKYKNVKKCLIVCPKIKVADWVEDVKHELCLTSSNLTNEAIKNGLPLDVYAVNYELIWRRPQILQLLSKEWCIILDESHKIKNPKSKVSRFTDKLRLVTPHKIILTGTPQSQGYIDYFNQLRFVDKLKMSFKDFKKRYCVYNKQYINGYKIDVLVGYQNTHELDYILNNDCTFFNRDIKYSEIPQHIKIKIPHDTHYTKLSRSRLYKDIVCDNYPSLRARLREICSGYLGEYEVNTYKLDWLKEFLTDLNERVVIYYNLNIELYSIKAMLERLNIPYSVFNTSLPNLNNFLLNKNGVVLCQYQSASAGTNDLVIANVYVAYSPTTSYIDFVQSRKRIDRIGQTVTPVYYYLYMDKTVETLIYKSLEQGQDFDLKTFDKSIDSYAPM